MAGRYPTVPRDRRTCDGIVFDSKKEMDVYLGLKLRERLGEIKQLTHHPAYKCFIGGQHFTTYTPDFSYIINAENREEIVEVKSSGTRKDPAYRLRKKAAELQYGIHIREIVR